MSESDEVRERLEKIKEERRRLHALRLIETEGQIKESLDNDESLSRFNKYRRSGRSGAAATFSDETPSSSVIARKAHTCESREKRVQIRDDKALKKEKSNDSTTNNNTQDIDCISSQIHNNADILQNDDRLSSLNQFVENSTLNSNQNPIIQRNISGSTVKGGYDTNHLFDQDRDRNRDLGKSNNSTISFSNKPLNQSSNHHLKRSSSEKCPVNKVNEDLLLAEKEFELLLKNSEIEDEKEEKMIKKKPSIPSILKTEDETEENAPSISRENRKPSILKRHNNNEHNVNSNTQQVSFDQTSSISSLTRAKSSECCQNDYDEPSFSGILKKSPSPYDYDMDKDYDQRSILKTRRSSLEGGSEGGIQGILKRKHSYDSSVILSKEWNSSSNVYSLSTHSLPNYEESPSPEPRPILKNKKSSSEDLEDTSEPKPILKHRDRADSCGEGKIKPCLKKPKSFNSSSSQDSSDPMNTYGKGILKNSCGSLKSVESGDNNEKHPTFVLSEDLNHTHRSSYPFSSDSDNKRLPNISFENLTNRRVSEPNPKSEDFLFSDELNANRRASPNTSFCRDSEFGSLTRNLEEQPTTSTNNYNKSSSSLASIQDFLNAKAQLTADKSKPPRFPVYSLVSPEEKFPQKGVDKNNLIDSPKMDLVHKESNLKDARSDSQEEIIMSLSVADKRSLFLQMELEQEPKFNNRKFSESGPSSKSTGNDNLISSKSRFYTQPVTVDEIEKASKMVISTEDNGIGDNKLNFYDLSDTLSKISDNATVGGADHPDNMRNTQKCKSEPPQKLFQTIEKKLPEKAKWNTTPISIAAANNPIQKREFISEKPKPLSTQVHDNDNINSSTLLDDPTVSSADEFEPTKMSFRERLSMFNDMFNGLASPSSPSPPSNRRLPIKKSVTSKRFQTQPVTFSEHLQLAQDKTFIGGGDEPSTFSSLGQRNELECIDHKDEDITSSDSKSLRSRSKESFSQKENNSILSSPPLPPKFKMHEKISLRNSPPPPNLAFSATTPEDDDYSNSNEENDSSSSESPPTNEIRRKRLSQSSSSSSIDKEEVEVDEDQDDNSETMLKGGEDFCLPRIGKVNRNSIAERVQALKSNGELNWKKRISKDSIDSVKIPLEVEDQIIENDQVELRNKDKANTGTTNLVSARLSLLESASLGWKKRISENDSKAFTVGGKLEKAGKLIIPKDISADKVPLKGINKIVTSLRTPRTRIEATDRTKSTESSAESDKTHKENNIKYQRSKSLPQSSESGTGSGSGGESAEEDLERITRNIAQNDNETFTDFFESKSVSPTPLKSSVSNTQIDESSFKSIQSDSSSRTLLGVKRTVKAPRNHHNVRNPIKSLTSRMNISEQAYSEVNPIVREKEMKKRVQIDNLSKHSHLAIEALAGLKSKEDFSAIQLKKAELNVKKRDYPHPMLIRIKGKRIVQSRLVPPKMSSISSGDNFILVTSDKLFVYIGEYSNRMERSKCSDLVAHITTKKALGCRLSSPSDVIKLEEPLLGSERDLEKFRAILGDDGGQMEDDNQLGDEADELYELGVNNFNRIYSYEIEKKVYIPLETEYGWGNSPKHSILKEDKILVFDFGSEFYIWSGSRADPEAKKEGYRIAKEMYDNGYDFGESGERQYSPISGSLKGESRPDWCWCAKTNQFMEPILFAEKFFDWPDDTSRLIRVQVKRSDSKGEKDPSLNFNICNIDEMIKSLDVKDPGLELETFNVERGKEVYDEAEFRSYLIGPISLKTWKINEFSKQSIDNQYIGHFYSEETYVIRWQYRVSQVTRDLKGNMSKHPLSLGRERTAYFFWQGRDSSITEKGTVALFTVELDNEKGPQIRVSQGKENPAFLQLFKGLLFIHSGSYDPDKSSKLKDLRLFITLGCTEDEGHFVEIESVQPSSFRSKGSFLLINSHKSEVYVWHGCLSTATSRKIALNGGRYIEGGKGHFEEKGRHKLYEIEEGEETEGFLSSLGIINPMKWKESYISLCGQSQNKGDYEKVDVFHFSSLSNTFSATPVFSIKRYAGKEIDSFPILCEDLYSAQQPTFFLVSAGREVWLWQGHKPRGDDENDNMISGSTEIRFQPERRKAIETTQKYAKEFGKEAYLVYAGLEPKTFINIFPYWKVNDEAKECHLSEGKIEGNMIRLDEAIKMYLKTVYTFEELSQRPEGIDLLKLETYLSNEDFQELLKMSREEFNKLQKWKQSELKRAVGLF